MTRKQHKRAQESKVHVVNAERRVADEPSVSRSSDVVPKPTKMNIACEYRSDINIAPPPREMNIVCECRT